MAVDDLSEEIAVAILHPRRPDLDLVPACAGGRRVAVRCGSYRDSAAARNAKAAGVPGDAVRDIEAVPAAGVRDALETAEVVLALDLPLDVTTLAPRLRWVQAYGAGIGQLVRVLGGSGVRLTTAAGVSSNAIAEFVLARLLQIVKRLRDLDEQQRKRVWSPLHGGTLGGQTMLLIGLGQIGTELARLAAAFGMRVTAVRKRPWLPAPETVDLVGDRSHLPAMLATADVVVVCAAETVETAHDAAILGSAEISAMRAGAVLVNVARRSLVDQAAAEEALRSGHLAAAVVDVTTPEPLPPEAELWEMPAAYISPHSSSSPDGYDARLFALFAENLARYASGRTMTNLADMERGY
jgi:phosphoglycerate dehydrogenase-like enzyme